MQCTTTKCPPNTDSSVVRYVYQVSDPRYLAIVSDFDIAKIEEINHPKDSEPVAEARVNRGDQIGMEGLIGTITPSRFEPRVEIYLVGGQEITVDADWLTLK